MVHFEKDLAFHKRSAYRASGTTAYIIVALGYAAVSLMAWAPIFDYLADTGVQSAATYFLHPYCPRPALNRAYAVELISYGKWITGSSIVEFLYEQGDDAAVGWLPAAISLGYYQLVYRISNVPTTGITVIAPSMMFSAYSKLQENQRALCKASFSTFRLTASVTLPMPVGICLIAPAFTDAFLGADWLSMVFAIQIFVAYEFFRALFVIFNPVWCAVGRFDVQTKLDFLKAAPFAAAVVPAISAYDIEGTAFVAAGILTFPMVPLYTREMRRTLNTTCR